MTGDIYHLPFEDNQFDSIWLCTVVMHLKRPVEALREIYRVLKPDGVIVITDSDWQGDIIYPVFRVIKEFSAMFEKILNEKGIHTNRAKLQRCFLREAGFKEIEGHAVVDCYGKPELTKAYAEFVIDVAKQHIDEKMIDLRMQMLESSWRAWAEQPDAFFSRTHFQAIGRKMISH